MILEKAYERIQVAADGKIYKSDLNWESSLKRFCFSPRSFLIFACYNFVKIKWHDTLIKRFALAEARRAEKYLEKDLANISDESKKQLAIKIIDDLFSVQIEKQDDYFVIPVSDYLKHSNKFS